MRYLLDTNVLSETIRKEPDARVVSWLGGIPQERFYISVLTLGEIRKGIEKLPIGAKRQQLLHWLETELITWFHLHIIPVDIEVAEKWGYLTATSKRPLPAIDSLIAASACTHNLTLATRNVADFKDVPGLEVVNPWEM